MENIKKAARTLTWVSFFAMAMAYLESAIVVYLRELFYKDGFQFPLIPIPPNIARVEFLRELATLIMLITIGILGGKTKVERFAYFIFAFAVWDIFYYVFLYLILGWPGSLTDWDILFLIPVPWVGPVWAPCLLCLLMIVGSVYEIVEVNKNDNHTIPAFHWWLAISGALACIMSFMWDYLVYSDSHEGSWTIFSNNKLFTNMSSYVPTSFNYTLFFIGFFLMSCPMVLSILKNKDK